MTKYVILILGVLIMNQAKAELPRTTPEAAGLDPAAVIQFADEIEAARAGLHSFMVIKGGRVAAEGYWRPYSRQSHSHVFSLTKSFTSLGIGFALQEGKLSLEDPVSKYFAADFPDPAPERVMRMTVRDLLTMQSGHSLDTMPAMFRAPKGGMARAFFAQELTHDPGTFFLYNNGASNMLSKIITRATGERLDEYLKPRLLDPLGIRPERWERDPEGDSYGGWGLHLRPEDIAGFGQFCLNRGRHGKKQMLNADYLRAAGSKQIAGPGLDPKSDWWPSYGYHFWQDLHGCYRADGSGGQLAMIYDELDAVLVFTASSTDIASIFKIANRTLVPALRKEFKSDRRVTAAELDKRLRELELPLPPASRPTVKLPRTVEIEFPEPPGGVPGKFQLCFEEDSVTLKLPEGTLTFPFDRYETLKESGVSYSFLAPEAWLRARWTAPKELSLFLFRDPVQCRLQLKFSGKTVKLSAFDRQTRRSEGTWTE